MLQADPFAAQRGTLVLWVPVALACGIGLYFQLSFEPSRSQILWTAVVCIGLLISGRLSRAAGPVLIFSALVGLGFWPASAHITLPPRS